MLNYLGFDWSTFSRGKSDLKQQQQALSVNLCSWLWLGCSLVELVDRPDNGPVVSDMASKEEDEGEPFGIELVDSLVCSSFGSAVFLSASSESGGGDFAALSLERWSISPLGSSISVDSHFGSNEHSLPVCDHSDI